MLSVTKSKSAEGQPLQSEVARLAGGPCALLRALP